MKQTFTLILAILLLANPFTTQAQDADHSHDLIDTYLGQQDYKLAGLKARGLDKKYRAIVLGIGTRGIASDPGTIVTNFVDDSPSMDSFSATEEIDDYQARVGVQFEFKFGRYEGLSHGIMFDLAFGNTEGVALGYSLGWNVPLEVGSKFLHVRPNVTGLIGNTRILLGRIQNNAGFIQINQTQFFDSQLNVKLNSSSALVRLGVDFMYPLTDRIHLYANVGYDFGSQVGEPDLMFESLATVDEQQSANKPLDTDNPNVTYNGEKVTELPFSLTGLRLTVGAAYVWSKN